MKDKYILIKNNLGTYWAGLNTWTDQIRKAQFYTSEKKAHEAAISAINKNNVSRPKELMITDYTLVTVSINVESETNSFSI